MRPDNKDPSKRGTVGRAIAETFGLFSDRFRPGPNRDLYHTGPGDADIHGLPASDADGGADKGPGIEETREMTQSPASAIIVTSTRKEIGMAASFIGDSPQAVAYQLLERIAEIEGQSLYKESTGVTRRYILDTYKECLETVIGKPG